MDFVDLIILFGCYCFAGTVAAGTVWVVDKFMSRFQFYRQWNNELIKELIYEDDLNPKG
ncbi:MAG: hypothetical protein U9M89_03240 [Patescibacteria group bacterium]|nr:hypothetical protein [Patescibacteria group bacterium]